MNRALKIGRKWLYEIHRWVGIASCLLFAVWFVSGVVMMYVPYPSLTDAERVGRMAPIDWSRVQVSPAAALDAAQVSAFPDRLRLEMMGSAPVYRIVGPGGRQTVDAQFGRVVETVSAGQALRLAAGFAGRGVTGIETIRQDQWTVAGGFNPHRPLHRVSIAGEEGRVLYVSSATGEIVQETTRSERFWNWVGSIPHWIYLTAIRQDNEAWRQVILWTSGPCIVSAVTGVWIGLLRVRIRRRYHDNKVSPYRGWMKWHHIGGLVTGLTLTTWIFSGWLSVNPFNWFARASAEPAAVEAYEHAGRTFPADLARLASAAPDARQVGFRWADGEPLAVATSATGGRGVFDAVTGAPSTLSPLRLQAAARRLAPGAPFRDASLLQHEDVYWYGHHGEVRLPVLRVRFDDKARTWFHIDPETGEVLGVLDANGRTERWLFNFLHDFDLPVLLNSRPSWDVLVWLLSIGGMVISVSGVVVGWRRLVHKADQVGRARRRRLKATSTA